MYKTKLITSPKMMASLCLLAACALLSSQRTAALKVSVSIPELVKLNDGFWLNCSHQRANSRQQLNFIADEARASGTKQQQQQNHQSNEEIYAIKWYKDEEEFYRYLPNAEPKVSIYETNGIVLDKSKSHEGNVFLSKADVNTEGNYRCEILSEAPIFETVRKSKHLKVYASPIRGPRIEILDASGRVKSPKAQEISYAVGDKIELRCNSAPSKPAARLRWYLNEKELQVPSANKSSDNNGRQQIGHKQQAQDYDVKVTPIEYRQHYKGIFSSHSVLILTLQQDDLINNKISFKCLASLRQEVPVQSKQLIVLTPSQATLNANTRLARARRFLSEAQQQVQREGGDSIGSLVQQSRQRSPNLRHGISRLPQSTLSTSRSQQNSKLAAATSGGHTGELINSLLLADSTGTGAHSMPYVYEDSDSTLGPSIIDRPEMLDSYLRGGGGGGGDSNLASEESSSSNNKLSDANYAVEFNKGDNVDFIQQQRDRLARQRSLPGGSSSTSGSSLKRIHGTNSLVKSPLYLDELDSLRPIINWPPMEAGRLMLLPSDNSIVAITTTQTSGRTEARFVLPNGNNRGDEFGARGSLDEHYDHTPSTQVMLDQLVRNLNCTCTDGIIDSKVGWLVNDVPLGTRDTRYFHTRVTQDHRPQITIGMQMATSGLSSSPATLQSILAKYYKSPESSASSSRQNDPQDSRLNANNLHLIPNDQLRFICQASHPLLLYSSSEMITFDFNPPPLQGMDGNSIDKFNPSPSNVIQATSASQSSSATGSLNSISYHPGSQQVFNMLTLALSWMIIGFRNRN